jgi:hypothetical protein
MKKVCRFYLKNECIFGNNCKFMHSKPNEGYIKENESYKKENEKNNRKKDQISFNNKNFDIKYIKDNEKLNKIMNKIEKYSTSIIIDTEFYIEELCFIQLFTKYKINDEEKYILCYIDLMDNDINDFSSFEDMIKNENLLKIFFDPRKVIINT